MFYSSATVYCRLAKFELTIYCMEVSAMGQDTKTPPSPFNENFNELTNKLLKDFHVPGISVAVVDGDDVFSKVIE